MRGGSLPPALLCAAFGLLLAHVPRHRVPPCLAIMAGSAILAALVPVPSSLDDVVFAGCWASVVATALLLHWPRPLPRPLLPALAANAGFWSGAVIALSGVPLDLARSLPWALVCLPAAMVLKTPARLGVKIVGSWLVAVAILAAAVPLVETPGYEPDHLE